MFRFLITLFVLGIDFSSVSGLLGAGTGLAGLLGGSKESAGNFYQPQHQGQVDQGFYDAFQQQQQLAPQQWQQALQQQQGLYGAGQQAYQTGFDPQNALYNQMRQQTMDTANANNSMYGLGASGAGAGMANQAMGNFDINWQNQQQQRQMQALQAMLQASQGGIQQGQYGQQGFQNTMNPALQYMGQGTSAAAYQQQGQHQADQFNAQQQQGAMGSLTNGLNQIGGSELGNWLGSLGGGGAAYPGAGALGSTAWAGADAGAGLGSLALLA